jgi:hypothetical protein
MSTPETIRKKEKAANFGVLPDTDHVAPWEMIEAGRYMPRRIRGSYRGRELG